jgi:hypothetical protein
MQIDRKRAVSECLYPSIPTAMFELKRGPQRTTLLLVHVEAHQA